MSASLAAIAAPLSSPYPSEIWPAGPKDITSAALLPTAFKAGGWSFRQLDRRGHICLFVKSKPGASGNRSRAQAQ